MDNVKTFGPTVAFVGPNGSGKSTLARRLTQDLQAAGVQVTLTREPGGSAGAEDIRRLILEGDADRWSPITESLLFMAARQDHLERTIWPALTAGQLVITDRYLDDTRVFQGLKDKIVLSQVEGLVKLLMIPEAKISLLIDVDPAVSMQRINARPGGDADRFEQMGSQFDHDVRQAFLALAEQNPDRIAVVDGNKDPDLVYKDVRCVLSEKGIC